MSGLVLNNLFYNSVDKLTIITSIKQQSTNIYSSIDLKTWKNIQVPYLFNFVNYYNDKYIAGYKNSLLTSSDLISWSVYNSVNVISNYVVNKLDTDSLLINYYKFDNILNNSIPNFASGNAVYDTYITSSGIISISSVIGSGSLGLNSSIGKYLTISGG